MPTRPIHNERKACDAVVRSLEAITHEKRINPRCPEQDGSGAPVEYVVDLGPQTYALEHTIVEAFPDQIRTGVAFGAFVAPIEQALDGRLPSPGMYRLAFPIDPCSGLRPSGIPQAQAQIIAWVREKSFELHAECPQQSTRSHRPNGHNNFRKGRPDGLPFDLHLSRETGWWMPEKGKGRLLVMRFAPKDYETLRRMRIKTALERKLPKLQEWKESGARSVLLLENGDISLSNHVVILDAVECALEERKDRPDEIWLVDTTISDEWTVLCLMRDGVSFPDEDAAVRYRDFNPNELTGASEQAFPSTKRF
jgi:hypothetical protein